MLMFQHCGSFARFLNTLTSLNNQNTAFWNSTIGSHLRFVVQVTKMKRCELASLIPGEGNGNPLQYSCLGKPMGIGTWRATVHGVTRSWTQLSNQTATTWWTRSLLFWPRSPWILSLSREINLSWLTGSLLILWTLQCLWEQENRLSHSQSDLGEAIHTQKPDKMVISQQTGLNKKRRLVRDAHLGEWGRGRSSSLLFTKPSALTWVWMQSGPSGLHGHRGWMYVLS